jgi:ATP-dependent DNA helicase PIF1
MNQARALDILKTGANVFLTGEPGAGKTYVINQYIAWLEAAGLHVAVTASTGIAATHIGGMTIHSWSGVGARDGLTQYDLDQIVGREATVKRVKKAQVLVIDEISMLDGKLLDMVDVICRTIRQKKDAFGGLQVIFVGDFFQLPPVTRNGDMMRYAFESRAWLEARPLVRYLTEQHRQEDELLLSLLTSIRRNEIEEDHYTLLNEQTDIDYEGIEPTRLYTHNADVDAVNATKLAALLGKPRTFSMVGRGSKPLLEVLVKNCLSPDTLQLKEDAMVMCTKNNFEGGYVNGTLGRVLAFDVDTGYPIIETTEGRKITIVPTTWDVIEDGKIRASIEQVPLRLAWAITVHKSQGMSLDAAEIDLSKAFVFGQGYVALSRVRSLAGLKVLGMNPNALQVDPKVVHRDAQFRAESETADDSFAAMSEDELLGLHMQFVTASGGKLPSEDTVIVPGKRVIAQRAKKGSTFDDTKMRWLGGATLRQIAKDRELGLGTIVEHIDKLVEQGELGADDLKRAIAELDLTGSAIPDINEALSIHGPEFLKPLYEATNELYDYALIRLVRSLYQQTLPH